MNNPILKLSTLIGAGLLLSLSTFAQTDGLYGDNVDKSAHNDTEKNEYSRPSAYQMWTTTDDNINPKAGAYQDKYFAASQEHKNEIFVHTNEDAAFVTEFFRTEQEKRQANRQERRAIRRDYRYRMAQLRTQRVFYRNMPNYGGYGYGNYGYGNPYSRPNPYSMGRGGSPYIGYNNQTGINYGYRGRIGGLQYNLGWNRNGFKLRCGLYAMVEY